LPHRGREIVSQAPDPQRISRPDQVEVLASLNDVIKQPKLADAKEFQPLFSEPPLYEQTAELLQKREELKKKKKDWSDPENRRFNRYLLEAVLPKCLRKLRPGGPEFVLTYFSRGDFFGEIGMLQDRSRTATCIAHGHPNYQGSVELVKLSRRAFWQLIRDVPELQTKLKAAAALRQAQAMERLLTPVWEDSRRVEVSEQFEELGLIQGQRLMLIDLERCTRCDECVKACVATHDDGRTRLFLDGPRFSKYLVPTSCRSCLDPVCLIGCPVGSIHRGDSREIIVENWCIGCGLCADTCPYGSIQMHDVGIIPEGAMGWRFLPAAAVSGDRWKLPGYHDAAWLLGDAPIRLDRSTRDDLEPRVSKGKCGTESLVNFRYTFDLLPGVLQRGGELTLKVTSKASAVTVWLNGVEVKAEGAPKRDGSREYAIELKPKNEEGPRPKLSAARNVLAVQATASTKPDEIWMQARLDEVRRPPLPEEVATAVAEDIVEKLVMQRAVVCDLCRGGIPACVHACPHDAAMRVNARTNFPTR
jgi:Fe-S-cluster-containing hydrogenase component 2